jgi:hypothetical protein
MRNAVAFANNDVVTVAWSYGEKPEGCMGFALYRIDSTGQETALPSHAVFRGETIQPGQTTAQFPIQKFYWKDARRVAPRGDVLGVRSVDEQGDVLLIRHSSRLFCSKRKKVREPAEKL